MVRRYGWGLEDSYGWFMTAATSVLTVAFLFMAVAYLLVARYHWKVAGGDLHQPALRSIADSRPVPVLGANIGDVPSGTGIQALAGALKTEVKDLPWERALVRRNASGELIAIDSVF